MPASLDRGLNLRARLADTSRDMLAPDHDRTPPAAGPNAAHLAALTAFGAVPASVLAFAVHHRRPAGDTARRHDDEARTQEPERVAAIV